MAARWVHITWDFDGGLMSRLFPMLDEQIVDLSGTFEKVADALGPAIAHTFDQEGPGWAQLRPSTVRQRELRIRRGRIDVGPRHPILQQTRALKRSLTVPGAPGHHRRIDRQYMSYGSTISYGGYHQRGTRKMVKRPPLDAERLTPVVSLVFEDEIPVSLRRAVRRVL